MGIGDEVMVTGHARVMQLTDPRKVKLMYERPNHWNEVFENNPRLARPGEQGDFQTYQPRVSGLRPYAASKSERRWIWRDYRPPVGELYFTKMETTQAAAFSVDAILEPSMKPRASPNKDWGWERWQALAILMRDAGFKSAQLGPRGTKVLNSVRLIETTTFRFAAAVLARARIAVLPEGGLHHAAAALGVKSVVIFGGYISPNQTGYDHQANLFTGGTPCGMRTPCAHCADAMSKITPEEVMRSVQRLLKA